MAARDLIGHAGRLVAGAYDLFVLSDRDGRVLSANRAVKGIDPLSLDSARVTDHFTEPGKDELLAIHARVADTGVAESIAASGAKLSGEIVHYQLSISRFGEGADVGLLDVAVDVTARRRREQELLRSEGLMIDTQGVAHLGTWEWDVSLPTATWSPELYRIYGVTAETYTPSYEEYLKRVHPEDRGYVSAATQLVFREHTPYSHDERIFRPDGSIRYLHTWARAILDDEGKLSKLIGVCQDITERKLAEIALAEQNERLKREMEERERIEARLLQTHKLEAIGRLAGGIAHDFNNLLGVVIGRASLLQSRLPPGDAMRAHLEEITSVGKQAARLTQQLLAFSREQPIRKEKLDLSRVVLDLERLLRRLISEDIELQTSVESEPCLIEADRSQIEQVIMNLVVNARDAMPRGGRVTIETKMVVPGSPLPEELDRSVEYVSLSVLDTGIGMDPSTLDRIFDPYFTTKDEGKGTGLGLSTVYGVVKQSGGAIAVTTAVNAGSRLTVYLPRATPTPEVEEEAAESEVKGGSERILLVEDQAPLRRMLRQILEDKGYAVLEAETPGEALRLAEEMGSKIALLVTDVVMPRMSGSELSERVRAIEPRIGVVHISGHADESLLNQEVLDRGGYLLRKPFTSHEFARAVRAALDRPASPSSSPHGSPKS